MKTAYPVLALVPLWLAAVPAASQPVEEDAGIGISSAEAAEQGRLSSWFETRVEIEDLADEQDYAAAIALGDRLLELAEQQFGEAGRELADAYLLLADVYRRSGDFRSAEQQILAAIDVLESGNGPLSTALIDPFIALGDNYEQAGDYASAIAAYDEARYIGRRSFGLLNEDQLGLLDRMTEAAEKLGQAEEAMELQLERLTLVERIYGETSLEAIDARFDYALWLREHNFFEEERRLYFLIERIVDEHHADKPLLLVRTLRERAASFRESDNGDAFGLAGLRDALELLEEMPDPPLLAVAQVLTDIGDWSVEFSRAGLNGEEYLRAWRLLGQLDAGEALRKAWFEDLNVVDMSSLSRRGLSTDENDPEGYVVVYFTVDTLGRTRDIEITDSQPPGFKDSAVARLMREARFRPRIIDGEIVPTRRAYRFEFRYQPAAID